MSKTMEEICQEMMSTAGSQATTAAGVQRAASSHPLAAGAAAVTAAAGLLAGRGLFRAIFANPWVTLTAGIAAGYLVHKYQREIIATAIRTTDMAKDFALEQKEKLSDLIEEAKETEEQRTGGETPEEPREEG